MRLVRETIPISADHDWEWRTSGRCRTTDPDVFYAEEGSSQERLAKKICSGCAVRERCGEHAVRIGEDDGIWGGLTPRERRRLRWTLRY